MSMMKRNKFHSFRMSKEIKNNKNYELRVNKQSQDIQNVRKKSHLVSAAATAE